MLSCFNLTKSHRHDAVAFLYFYFFSVYGRTLGLAENLCALKICAASLFAAIGSMLIEVVPSIGCLLAAQRLHDFLMSVLHKPLSFFDTTPVGRILVVFSRDIEILDNCLRAQVIDTVWCSVEVC